MRRINDPEPVCCAVCKRAAAGFGYTMRWGQPVKWLCDNLECISLGSTIYKMSIKALSQQEAISLAEAGDAAGEYLQSINKTDLAELDREEWLTFLKTVMVSYEQNMRTRLLNNAVTR